MSIDKFIKHSLSPMSVYESDYSVLSTLQLFNLWHECRTKLILLFVIDCEWVLWVLGVAQMSEMVHERAQEVSSDIVVMSHIDTSSEKAMMATPIHDVWDDR